jgi:hypothetical protein
MFVGGSDGVYVVYFSFCSYDNCGRGILNRYSVLRSVNCHICDSRCHRLLWVIIMKIRSFEMLMSCGSEECFVWLRHHLMGWSVTQEISSKKWQAIASETSNGIYQTTRRYNPEDCMLSPTHISFIHSFIHSYSIRSLQGRRDNQ